jgi:hypothetical protein
MVAQQRYAFFQLSVALAALALFAAMIPSFGVVRAQAAFSLLAVLAVVPLVHWRLRHRETWDERDHAIHRRAAQLSFMAFWLLCVIGLMAAYHALRHRGLVTVEVLPLLVWIGGDCLLICQSAILLILYRIS